MSTILKLFSLVLVDLTLWYIAVFSIAAALKWWMSI